MFLFQCSYCAKVTFTSSESQVMPRMRGREGGRDREGKERQAARVQGPRQMTEERGKNMVSYFY